MSDAIVSCVLQASPFHTTQLGPSSAILSTAIPNGFICACVSFTTQKCDAAPAPSVLNEYTRGSSSLPMIFIA